MSAQSSPILKARSRVGVAARLGDAKAESEARRDLAAAMLAQRAKRVAETAPELTAEQIDTIVTILRGGSR